MFSREAELGTLFAVSPGHQNKPCGTNDQTFCASRPLVPSISLNQQRNKTANEFLVSKETVVLRRWERSKQKFGFIKRVDKGWITTVKDLESWRFER